MDEEILAFFKTLVDAERLKVVGLLAIEPRTPVQIAELLGLRAPVVIRHLERLSELGLVKMEGRKAHLDTDELEALARRALAGRRPSVSADDFEGEAYDRKVLSDFLLPDGRLRSIPAQHKKRMVLLRHLAESFQAGERYPEKQVNEKLHRFHEDTASLRRYLVDEGLLAREYGVYWRI